MKHLLSAAAISVMALAATSASASTVRLDYTGSGPFGSPNLSETVTIAGPSRGPLTVKAGPFRVTDGTSDFVAWCFDIAQNVANGVTYTLASNPLGTARASLLNRLFSSHYDKVDTAEEGVARGQACVLYDPAGSTRILGGGFIAGTIPADERLRA